MPANRLETFGRWATTVVLFFSWICLGFYCSFLGPSLPALRAAINGTTEQVSRALSVRSGGLLVGSVLGGVAHDRFQAFRGCFVGTTLIIVAFTLCLVPLCTSVVTLALSLFALGVCHGVHTTGGNPMMVVLWGHRAPGALNFMHAGFGVGSALVPPILRAFAVPSGNATFIVALQMHLQRCYVALATPCLFTGLLLLLLAILTRKTTDQRSCDGGRKNSKLHAFWAELTSSRRNLRLTVLLLAVMFFVYFLIIGSERVFARFLYSYASEGPLAFSAAEALQLNSVMWIAFTTSRFIAAAALIKVPVDVFLAVLMICETSAAAVMLALADNRLAFWIGVTSFAFFKSPAFATGLSCVNVRLEVGGTVNLIANIGSALGGLALQWPVGYFFDRHGPGVFPIINVVLATAVLITSLLLIAVGRWKGSRFKAREEVLEENVQMVS